MAEGIYSCSRKDNRMEETEKGKEERREEEKQREDMCKVMLILRIRCNVSFSVLIFSFLLS